MLIKAHQYCDRCNSSDALAIYDDATKCFSCGWREAVKNHSLFANSKYTKSENGLQISDTLPKDALAYLLKYRIFQSDITSSGIKYDYVSHRILFPMAADGSYQGRSLDKDKIKYMTYGDKSLKIFGDGDITVLCEDWLSAYRVAQCDAVRSVCLFGTNCLSNELLKIISSTNKIIIWLDNDRAGITSAKKIMKSLANYYLKLYNVNTINDPKTYSDSEIKDILYERISNHEGCIEERKLQSLACAFEQRPTKYRGKSLFR